MTIASTTVTWRLPTEKPTAPCSVLVMFEPDNEWGLTAEYAIQVEFDFFTNFPKQFTWYDYSCGPVPIDDCILCWCELPTPPSVELLHR